MISDSATSASTPAPTPKRIRRGLLIGAGYFSDFHLDAWKRMPGAEIVAVCDIDFDRARAAAKKYGIDAVYTGPRQAIEHPSLDFVDIVTPPHGRLELIELCLGRDLALILQKPLADDFQTAERIVQRVRSERVRSRRTVMVHENFRFQPWYREIKRLIASGIIGLRLHTITMRTRMGDGWGQDAYLSRQPYFRTMPRLLLHETGIHFVDTFRYLAGEVVRCSAHLRRLNDVIAGEDTGLLVLEHAQGATTVWDANRYNESGSDDPRYTFGDLFVECDGGSIWLDGGGSITIKRLGESPTRHDYQPSKLGFAGDCVFACQQHFMQVLDGEVECETSPEEYLRSLRVIEAAYQSAAQKRSVSLEESKSVKLRPEDSQSVVSSGSCAVPRVIDLTLPITPTMRGVEISVAKTIERDGWNATTLSLYSHAGTHMDAPRHFCPEEATLERQDLSVCCGPARVVNLAPVEPHQLITVADVEGALGAVKPGDRLLIRTDWHHHYGTDEYRDALPRISIELARWLVDRRVALIGVEPPSVADVNERKELTEVHQTLFRGGVTIVEGLANLDQLTQSEVDFIALPLNVVGGDGSPVRAIALERGNHS